MIDIRAEHLSKRYMLPPGSGRGWRPRQAFWALKDVSFGVRRGEALGVVGPNGSGKSTLVKLFSRITAPSEGTITLNGRLSALRVGRRLLPGSYWPREHFSQRLDPRYDVS